MRVALKLHVRSLRFHSPHRYSSKKPQKTSKNPNLSSGSDFVISVYRKDFTKSEPPLKREVIMGQAQGRITNTGGPIAQTKPNAVEIRRTQAVAAMSQTYAALG